MDDRATASPALRGLRALLLAAVGLTTGATFHVSADGLLPGPWALAALLALSTAGTAPFLGAPASTRRVVVLLVAGQTLIHGALTVLSGHRGDRSGVDEDPGEHASGVWSRVHHLIEDMTGPHAVMALGHLLAAALVGLWLASGERALWRVLTLAVRPVLTALGALGTIALAAAGSPIARPVKAPQIASGGRPLVLWFLVRTVPRRGPPAVG